MFGQLGIVAYDISGSYTSVSCSAVAATLRTTLIRHFCGPSAASLSALYGIRSTAFQPEPVGFAVALHSGR